MPKSGKGVIEVPDTSRLDEQVALVTGAAHRF